MKKNILITGGAGFIGSHVVRLFVNKYPDYQIINLDALTYAGNLENLRDIDSKANYTFIKGDITDLAFVSNLFKNYKFEGVLHLAAESHVDRSITGPDAFIETNVKGTHDLLKAAKTYWLDENPGMSHLFQHVSNDEVYGTLGPNDPPFREDTPYAPNSPYAASKASSDFLFALTRKPMV